MTKSAFFTSLDLKEIMPEAGYSGTPLIKKLGLKSDYKVIVLHQPEDYFVLLATDISPQICNKKEIPDWVHLFAATRKVFENSMASLKPVWKKNPKLTIWVSWYKKSSGIPTDLNEDLIRGYALANGLVDIKVCAVNEVWSGLKLVVPLKKR